MRCSAVPSYRFTFHSADERILGEERHTLANDDTAIRYAEGLLPKHPAIMVWLGDRFVKRVSQRNEPR